MLTGKENQQVITLQVTDGLTVAVLQDSSHEFLMTTEDVAFGYGVAKSTISSNKSNHKDELQEGVHWVSAKGVQILDTRENRQPHQVYWTKAGVIRLGFFIKSERAKMFRDWVEQLVLKVLTPDAPALPAVVKRKHNRLDAARLLRVMSLVALVPNAELRNALVKELMPDDLGIGVQLSLLNPAL